MATSSNMPPAPDDDEEDDLLNLLIVSKLANCLSVAFLLEFAKSVCAFFARMYVLDKPNSLEVKAATALMALTMASVI